MEDDKNKEQVFIESKDIICPECYGSCLMDIKNYKIIKNKIKRYT